MHLNLKKIYFVTYLKIRAAGGTLVNSSPEIKKQLEEQLNRLAQKFKLESSNVVGKLQVDFEKPILQSSVLAITEGRSIDDLLKEVEKRFDYI